MRVSWPHRHTIRVYYEDTDAAGIVYYANYLKFIERARTEMLRHAGFDHRMLMDQFASQFAVRRCVVDYRRPARLDDELVVETSVLAASGAKLTLCQRVLTDVDLLAEAEVVLAFIDARHRPVRLPPILRQELAHIAPERP